MKKRMAASVTAVLMSAVLGLGFLIQGGGFLGGFHVFAAEYNLDARTKDAVVLYLKSPIAYVNDQPRFIDNGDFNVTPIMENERTLVPFRFIADAFGAKASWNENTQKATIELEQKKIVFTVGNQEMVVDEEPISMDVAPKTINETTYVPLGFFAEALNKEVFFNKGLIIISNTKVIFDKDKDRAILDKMRAKINNLPTVGTKENFIEMVGKPEDRTLAQGHYFRVPENTVVLESGEADSSQASGTAESDLSVSSDYSTTNVQVQGVDEGDVIKTDGEYIYYIKQDGSISVVKANPPEKMALDFTVSFEDEGFRPQEIYLNGSNMVVIGSTAKEISKREREYYQYTSITRAYIFDIQDKKNVKNIREVETEGYYVSSRKIGESVYFITNADLVSAYGHTDYVLPVYKDTVAGDKSISVGYEEIYYFPTIYPRPQMVPRNFAMVTGFDLDKPAERAKVNTYFGGGGDIYCSTEHMYIASRSYIYNSSPSVSLKSTGALSVVTNAADMGGTINTTIYQFSLKGGDVIYSGRQDVPGTVLNQFAMDESNGYFRIATTSYDKNYQESNNLYVLDSDMNRVGKIENIAPGERIYSTRFMGDRAYMVTFKTVDPLFVIDLKEPANPTILGALKIPGYSNYLHPYDENHLIGFGKDTIEQYGNAYYQGMKISMFDVTDVSDPKEMFVEYIGDRGTESDLLNNHRALLFSKEKNIMAFPVMVAEKSGKDKNDKLAYGEFSYQGAYVYGIDLEKGFQLRGKITHMKDGDVLKAGMYNGDYAKYIQRILYIGENLFTASDGMIKATGISDMKEKGNVNLE